MDSKDYPSNDDKQKIHWVHEEILKLEFEIYIRKTDVFMLYIGYFIMIVSIVLLILFDIPSIPQRIIWLFATIFGIININFPSI